MIRSILWTVLFLAAVSYFTFQVWRRLAVMLKMRRDDGRDYSSRTWAKRIEITLLYAIGQLKFFRGGGFASFLHIIVFWGFLLLGVQVVTTFARGWFPDCTLPGFSSEHLGGFYAFSKDIFQGLVLFGVIALITRWAITKPKRLYGFEPAENRLRSHSHGEAYLILVFIGGIMVAGFLYDASRIVTMAGDPEVMAEARWQPISSAIATLLVGNVALAAVIGEVAWWTHNTIILVFLNLLPISKHFHIVTGIPNVFFGKLEPLGRLTKTDFTAETPTFGRSEPHHFTWKQTMDMYSCTECGRCSSVCPATATGKPLAPRQFLLNLRDNLYNLQPQIIGAKESLDGKFDVVVGEGKAVIDEVIWSCNACRACEEACPVNIEYVDKIVGIRQHLTQEASRFPEELARTFKGLEINSNPWAISAEERMNWAEGMNVPVIAENPNPEYLYYVGCGGAFDANNRNTTQSFVRILKQAGVKFAVMGKEELCNGETARRLGNEYLYQTMAEALVTKINAYGVKKILVNCPHCFNTLKNEYPQFGGNWEVVRAATLVNELVASGKVKLETSVDKKIVYHDSCYYGRFNDVVEEPRELLGKIPGVKLEEMEKSKKQGMCCGAGGGRMWMEEKADQRVNVARAGQALEHSPDVIATSCPYCRIMIGNGVTDKHADDKVQVLDVIQLVDKSMTTTT